VACCRCKRRPTPPSALTRWTCSVPKPKA
jgi:hypothetical protein